MTVSAPMIDRRRTERWPGVFHTELPAVGVSLIDRVIFSPLPGILARGPPFRLVQFRSIFEGVPLLRLHPRPRLIFEVNGLPSIELKYRIPGRRTIANSCAKSWRRSRPVLQAADRIVTPSAVTGRYLARDRGVDARQDPGDPQRCGHRAIPSPAAPPPGPDEEIRAALFRDADLVAGRGSGGPRSGADLCADAGPADDPRRGR